MTTVLVTGGSGTVGTHLVRRLREEGHEVRVLSRRPGAGTHVGDLATGQGVADAVRGAPWVVHAASDTRRLGRRDVEQTQKLLRAAEVADRLAELITQPPAGRAEDFGGPEVRTLGDMATSWRERRGRPRRMVRVPLPGRTAGAVRQGHLTCPEHRDGRQTWPEFVSRQPLPTR